MCNTEGKDKLEPVGMQGDFHLRKIAKCRDSASPRGGLNFTVRNTKKIILLVSFEKS